MAVKDINRAGNPGKNWVALCRVGYWYQEIRKRTDWTDYQLDIEFSWKEKHRESKSGLDRPKTFEAIRLCGREPRDSVVKHSMKEMVSSMDTHKEFAGTKAIYESDLWTLLSEREVPIDRHVQVVKALFEKYNIVRSTYEAIYMPDPRGAKCRPRIDAYWKHLAESMDEMQFADCLTCYWHIHLRQLHAEADPFKMRSRVERKLQAFFVNSFENLDPSFLEYAHEALMVSRLSFASEEQKKYYVDLWSDQSPYICKEMIGKVHGIGDGLGRALSMLLDPAW